MSRTVPEPTTNEPAPMRLAELRDAYVAALPERLRRLGDMLDAVMDGGQADVPQLLHDIQGLAGAAGAYGLEALSRQALELVARLHQLLPLDGPADSALRDELLQRMALLRSQPSGRDLGTLQRPLPTIPRRRLADLRGSQTLIITDHDAELAHSLAVQLGCYGYRALAIDDASALVPTLDAEGGANVVIVGLSPQQDSKAIPVLDALRASRWNDLPVLVLSAHDDFVSRLHAVHAGANGFLPKPVDLAELIDSIERFDRSPLAESERVLIVDDDRAVAGVYASALRRHGVEVVCVYDAAAVESALADFHPELLLLDLYMPVWNGMELAAAIRLHPAYFSLPIVFLSAEEDSTRQLAAMRYGGDEFLTKPIELNHLVGLVRARVARYRQLRSLMLQDSLTGVLNHAAVMGQLEVLLSRATRTGLPLSVAMLDLDRFKQVNDHYGHPAGDRVLKSLTFLLKQRLRGSDVVGRFGGEEFVLLMPDTDPESAVQVLDTLRAAFCQLAQRAGDEVFHASFSVGIAAFPGGSRPGELIAAADQALYRAKEGGRNRIERYGNDPSP